MRRSGIANANANTNTNTNANANTKSAKASIFATNGVASSDHSFSPTSRSRHNIASDEIPNTESNPRKKFDARNNSNKNNKNKNNIRLEESDTSFGEGGNHSDSDDTAELVRQLSQKASPRNHYSVVNPSFSLYPKETSASTSTSTSTSRDDHKRNNEKLKTKRFPGEITGHLEYNNDNDIGSDIDSDSDSNADDESSLDDTMTNTMMIRKRRQRRPRTNPVTSDRKPQTSPKRHYLHTAGTSNGKEDDLKHQNMLTRTSIRNNNDNDDINNHHSPIRFQLPPQLPSSDESSEEGEESSDEEEEENKQTKTDATNNGQQHQQHWLETNSSNQNLGNDSISSDARLPVLPFHNIQSPRGSITETANATFHSLNHDDNSNHNDNRYSLSEGVIPKDGENQNDAVIVPAAAARGRKIQQQDLPERQENDRYNSQKPTEAIATTMRNDRELFEAAFSVPEHSSTGTTRHNDFTRGVHRSQRGQGSSSSSPLSLPSVPQYNHGTETTINEELFGPACLDQGKKKTATIAAASTRPRTQFQPQQQCIDLIDSEDDSEGERPKTLFRGNRRRNCVPTCQMFENEASLRSPNRRRSPKFNIASRDFLHNNRKHRVLEGMDRYRRHEEFEPDDDGVHQFEDDGDNGFKANIRSIPNRPRGVTQDHTNHIVHHNNGTTTRSSVFNSSFQQHHHFNPHHCESEQEEETAQEQYRSANNHRSISRPWPSAASARTTPRRLRDPTASNLSLVASVAAASRIRGAHSASRLPLPSSSTTATSYGGNHRRISQQQQQQPPDNANNNTGDIRTFMKRPSLVQEIRNRARTIESVRSNRYDVQGHANVTVIRQPEAEARRSRSQTRRTVEEHQKELQDDVIEVYDDGESAPSAAPTRSRRTAPATKAKPKAKRRRAGTRKAKPRKTGRRKRTRSNSSGRTSGGGGRYAKRGRGSSGNSDCGAWGPITGGWASARPVNREDPAFQNVGAEITF